MKRVAASSLFAAGVFDAIMDQELSWLTRHTSGLMLLAFNLNVVLPGRRGQEPADRASDLEHSSENDEK